ncbi:nuclear transport factor 2 family protein [Roseateles albus]|uniref:Nuclear transport factor 2 family protein n=1 Tax=Roseateles albus TaxID=2987525 RepID=A0ABT5KEF4_9BURK|nr:nuclear transport factor 2 family protein [Roseateles albus]MDC8771824.1 nuclear transport factor 2 family protein [Roseateles albus]
MQRRHNFLPKLILGLSLLASLTVPTQAAQEPQTAHSPTRPDYQSASAKTKAIAEAYLHTYIQQDWVHLGEMMDEQISFRDPSAKLVFGELGQEGKSRLIGYFKATYPYIETHSFKLERSFFAGEQAVFIGVSDWSFAPPGQPVVRSVIPLVIAIQVKHCLVVEHLEMGDLQPYVDAASLAQKRSQGPGRAAAQAQAN